VASLKERLVSQSGSVEFSAPGADGPPASEGAAAARLDRPVLSLGGRGAAKAPLMAWKCKPCGSKFEPAGEALDGPFVRCPNCRAKLGLAADFQLDPPPLERLRARQAVVKPAPPPERKGPAVQIKRRSGVALARGAGLRRAP
jgi:DNA-directed RNA polymerase subunit RPC12/RpoP